MFHARLLALLAFASIPSLLLAHDGDDKRIDPSQVWHGPGYRRDRDGANNPLATQFPAVGITLMSWIPLDQFGPSIHNANSGWGYVSPSGREYAIIGLSIGTGFVEVTNPGNAQIVSMQPGPVSLWRDIRIYSHYAYAVSEGGVGVQVFDLDQIDNGVVTLANTVTIGGVLATHTICIDTVSGYLYRAGGAQNGLRIYSLADPLNPALVATWSPKYVHEVSVFTYSSGPYAGRQIAFCCDGYNTGWTNTGLDVVDVTDKANIQLLGHNTWPNAGYSHQSWPTPDMHYLYVNDERDEKNYQLPTTTMVFDISDLTNPALVGTFTNGNTAIGHNCYTRGKFLFEANYRSGLRVFDTTNPISPTESYYFDTVPNDDAAAYGGLWNVFAYLPSGTITGSDMEKGLFVWRIPGLPPPSTYCAGKPNSQGCTPTIGFSGTPSWNEPVSFDINASNVLNQKFGLFFYGLDASSAPFHGGTLCVSSPITRLHIQNSGGSSSGTDCTGGYTIDFNAYLQLGVDPALGLGTTVYGQYWSRDPNDPTGFFDSLSNAIRFSLEV